MAVMFSPLASASSVPLAEQLSHADADVARPWQVTVWDDPVNLTSYVTYVFQRHFGYSRARAEELMWQVHREGRAIVAAGDRELMARHCEAMHIYGLWATIGQAP